MVARFNNKFLGIALLSIAVLIATYLLYHSLSQRQQSNDAQLIRLTDTLQTAIAQTPNQSLSELDFTDQSKWLEHLQQRKQALLKAMQTNPALALEQAISFTQYQQAPENIKPLLEQPISQVASLDVIAIEPDFYRTTTNTHTNYPTTLKYRLHIADQSYRVKLFGNRQSMTSKNAVQVQGIILEQWAAIDDANFSEVHHQDIAYLQQILPNKHDITTDYLTGDPITNQPIIATSGGGLYYFNDRNTLKQANTKLSELDLSGHPKVSGHTLLLQNKLQKNNLLHILESNADVIKLASSWSNSDKSILFIRTLFSDNSTHTIDQTSLQSYIDNSLNQYFQTMSYGQVAISGVVSTSVSIISAQFSYIYTSPISGISSINDELIYDDALSAYEQSNPSDNINDYDIIAVVFPSNTYLGENDSRWAGLATVGGSKMWIQSFCGYNLLLNCDKHNSNVYTDSVIPHELGHNFGLLHASYFDNNSVAGNTSNIDDYGNIFDIMGDGYLPESGTSIYNKDLLNWLGSSDLHLVNQQSGLYRIYRFDQATTTGKKGIRIQGSGNKSSEYYWLQYHRNYTNDDLFNNGIALNWQRAFFSRVYLMDLTVNSKSYTTQDPDDLRDSPLLLGRTFSDSYLTNVHITPYRRGGTSPNFWIDVNLQFDVDSSNTAPNNISLNVPAKADIGKLVILSVSANDNDGDSLSFDWNLGDNTIQKNSNIIAHYWTQGGTYTISLTVSDMKGGVTTVNQDIVIEDPFQSWQEVTVATTTEKDNNRWFYSMASNSNTLLAAGSLAFSSASGNSFNFASVIGINASIYDLIFDGTNWFGAGGAYFQDVGNKTFHPTIFKSSNNGASWSDIYHNSNIDFVAVKGNLLNAIASNGASVVIAVGGDSQVIRSANAGNSWTAITSGINSGVTFDGIDYGDNTFVAVGDRTVIYSTDNGLNWAKIHTLTSGQLAVDVTYINGSFYVSASEDFDVTLPNGIAIKGRSAGDFLWRIAYGNGYFVAAANDTNTIYISVDGDNWNQYPNATTDCNDGVHFYNNRFYLVGQNNPNQRLCIYRTDIVSSFVAETQDTDNDTMPDIWEVDFELNYLINDTNQDLDGDGYSNLQEYQGNSAPNDATSEPQAQKLTIGGNQQIYPTQTATISINYDNSSNNNQLSGVGFRLHYNSQRINIANVSNIFSSGKSTQTVVAVADSQDLDNDSDTDSYFEIGWQANQWPNTTLPLQLLTVDVTATQLFRHAMTTTLTISSVLTDSDYILQANTWQLTSNQALITATWDVDLNGQTTPLEDGILLLRSINQYSDDPFNLGVSAVNAAITNAALLKERADYIIETIGDIDGNGLIEASVDGAILMRYLYDFNEVTTDITISTSATRTTEGTIKNYLKMYD